jgi:hypothetical protein
MRLTILALLLGAATLPALAQAPQYTPPPVTTTNVLANVHYDYKWEFYGGVGFRDITAGPALVQNASLGGFDAQIARFVTPHWAIAATGRGYYGTSGVQPNDLSIRGPFVMEHWFAAGPEYRLPSNKHASVTLHAFFGGADGNFQHAVQGLTSQQFAQLGLFRDQVSFASALGGAIDLNRSPRWAFRISPDAILTDYNGPNGGGLDAQFALSVGVVYRFQHFGLPFRARKK